jgi:AraC-like DNA-binding protein
MKLFLLLNPVYAPFFWLLVLNLKAPGENNARRFLGKFMLAPFLLYLAHMFFFYPVPAAYHYIDSVYQFCSLFVIPGYYVYVRLLTLDKAFSWRQHARYFALPFALFVFHFIGVLLMTRDEHLDFVFNLIPAKVQVTGVFLYQKIVLTVCTITFIIQAIIYLTLSIRTLYRNKAQALNFYSNTEEDNTGKIFQLSITFAVAGIFSMVISSLGKEFFVTNAEVKLIAPSVIFSAFYFTAGWLGSKQRTVLTDNNRKEAETAGKSVTSETRTKLEAVKLEPIRQKLESLFEKEQLFLNPDLTIWDVAKAVGTNRTYISQAINQCYHQNFSGFVNAYRVRHAKKLQTDHPEMNKSDVAIAAGFNSRDSMNRAFGTEKENSI